MADIHKAAGIIIQNRKLLVSRSKGKTYFIAPGGKLENGETSIQALTRELKEEQSIIVKEDEVSFFGTFDAIAHGRATAKVQMDVFLIQSYEGNTMPDSEIEENRWVNSREAKGLEIGSIFAHDVIPKLKELDIID